MDRERGRVCTGLYHNTGLRRTDNLELRLGNGDYEDFVVSTVGDIDRIVCGGGIDGGLDGGVLRRNAASSSEGLATKRKAKEYQFQFHFIGVFFGF